MHRSGTSCLAGSLQQAGLHLGDVHTANPFNRRGNREHPRVMALNDAVLAANGGRWDNPALALHWGPALRAERAAVLEELVPAQGPWGFKDPRTVFTLPFWQEAVPAWKFAGTYRHPAAVARSLAHRNRFSHARGLALWREYNQRLLTLARRYAVPLIRFDQAPEAYRADLVGLLQHLGLEPAAADFFQPELRNHDDAEPIAVDTASMRVFAALEEHGHALGS